MESDGELLRSAKTIPCDCHTLAKDGSQINESYPTSRNDGVAGMGFGC